MALKQQIKKKQSSINTVKQSCANLGQLTRVADGLQRQLAPLKGCDFTAVLS